jgi:molybdopterin synthase catalytic subunit
MDYLKTRAPFWKRVEHASGDAISGGVTSSWVDAKSSDDAAADRWVKPRSGREAAE